MGSSELFVRGGSVTDRKTSTVNVGNLNTCFIRTRTKHAKGFFLKRMCKNSSTNKRYIIQLWNRITFTEKSFRIIRKRLFIYEIPQGRMKWTQNQSIIWQNFKDEHIKEIRRVDARKMLKNISEFIFLKFRQCMHPAMRTTANYDL